MTQKGEGVRTAAETSANSLFEKNLLKVKKRKGRTRKKPVENTTRSEGKKWEKKKTTQPKKPQRRIDLKTHSTDNQGSN